MTTFVKFSKFIFYLRIHKLTLSTFLRWKCLLYRFCKQFCKISLRVIAIQRNRLWFMYFFTGLLIIHYWRGNQQLIQRQWLYLPHVKYVNHPQSTEPVIIGSTANIIGCIIKRISQDFLLQRIVPLPFYWAILRS